MNATSKEIETRVVATHLVYALKELGREVPEKVQDATGYYGSPNEADWLTDMLCSLCRSMSETEQNEIIWNARSKDARRLADWWEDHQRVDKEAGR